jgi:hypothetical protein
LARIIYKDVFGILKQIKCTFYQEGVIMDDGEGCANVLLSMILIVVLIAFAILIAWGVVIAYS